MKKWQILAVAAISTASLTLGAFGDEPSPVTPTVIFLSREPNAFHPSSGSSETPSMSDVGTIIDAASRALKLKPYPSEYFENIVIVDEGENWFVSFHARGNGNVKPPKTAAAGKTDGSGYFLEDTNAGIYLEKKNLTRARSVGVIAKPISCLPLISPMGERVQGLGTVIKPIEETSK